MMPMEFDDSSSSSEYVSYEERKVEEKPVKGLNYGLISTAAYLVSIIL
jgi:hypothetical protein